MGERLGEVIEIHRYPVKSMQGERLEEVEASASGLAGDRSWAIRDEKREALEGARKLPALLGCHARQTAGADPDGAAPQVELPDGRTYAADDPALAEALSELVGRPVTLWPLRPADDEAHYRRAPMEGDDMLEELRQTFGRLPDEPLPDIGAFPPEVLMSATLPGTHFDAYPFFFLTRQSLQSLSERHPQSRFEARRFRPNLLLESHLETHLETHTGERETASAPHPFPENQWVGSTIQIGEARFKVEMECPRCVMTTHPMGDLPKDPQIMRSLVQENGGNLGVYASLVAPGRIRPGDAVTRVD